MPLHTDIIEANNKKNWDWITWETLGNPDDKFQKGDVAMKFGLWRADYVRLCKAGAENFAANNEKGVLGRGWIRVDVLAGFDYRPHRNLVETFLPFVRIDENGKLEDPLKPESPKAKYWIVIPYNYDDNSSGSDALFTKPWELEEKVGAARLEDTLERWSTASRSSAVRVDEHRPRTGAPYKPNRKSDPYWPFRSTRVDSDKVKIEANIFGKISDRDTTYDKTLSKEKQPQYMFYTVKAGVQYIGKEDQKDFGKTKIDHGVRTMKRSELIDLVRKSRQEDALKARYQIEILSVRLDTTLAPGTHTAKWDGFQVREIGATKDEVWFPALAIPGSGKKFAQYWAGEKTDWVTFWKTNFAEPLGTAKGEMLAFFGLQHQTANAQNMLIAFDRSKPGSGCKCVILRDFGDTLLNDPAYEVLNELGDPFKEAWAFENTAGDGITLTRGKIGGAYADPLMTRLGATIVFFSPPFQKGDLKESAAKTLATWGIAHNESFLAYFRNKVGYTADWQMSEGAAQKPPDYLWASFKKAYAAEMKPEGPYNVLKDDVLKLHSQQRQTLIFKIADECGKLDRAEPNIAKNLVGAHDMLIGAEVQCYLKSETGKKRLRELHENSRRK